MEEIHVCPGEVTFCKHAPGVLFTVVGVCVAVCLWDKVKKSGGVCHYILPEPPSKGGGLKTWMTMVLMRYLRY